MGHRRRNNCSSLVPQKQCTPLAFIISIPPPLGGATISFLCPSCIVPLVLRERRPAHLTKYRSILMDTPVARRADSHTEAASSRHRLHRRHESSIDRPHAISTTRVVDSKATSRNSRNKNTIINMVFGSDRPGTSSRGGIKPPSAGRRHESPENPEQVNAKSPIF